MEKCVCYKCKRETNLLVNTDGFKLCNTCYDLLSLMRIMNPNVTLDDFNFIPDKEANNG